MEDSNLSPTSDERVWTDSWITAVESVAIRQKFQAFLTALHAFAQAFRSAKYAEMFLSMASPVQALLLMLRMDDPPQDVMIATLSGCITTQLDQITHCKSGRRKQTEFLTHIKAVSVTLTKLVAGLQEGIRLDKKRDDPQQKLRPGSLNRSMVELFPYSKLVQMVNDLMLPPEPPSLREIFMSTLQAFPLLILLGCGLICVAGGSLMCAAWYQEIKFWSILVPSVEFFFGVTLIALAFIKSYLLRQKKDEAGLFAKTQKRSRDLEVLQARVLSTRKLNLDVVVHTAMPTELKTRDGIARFPPPTPPKIPRGFSRSPPPPARASPFIMPRAVNSLVERRSSLPSRMPQFLAEPAPLKENHEPLVPVSLQHQLQDPTQPSSLPHQLANSITESSRPPPPPIPQPAAPFREPSLEELPLLDDDD